MSRTFIAAASGLALLVAGGLAAWYWQAREPSAIPVVAPDAGAAGAPALPAPVSPAAPDPNATRAVEAPPAASSETPAVPPAEAAFDVRSVMTDLFGRKTVQGMFQMDAFTTRVAATVDNLSTPHAPARLWPVNPAHGRFLTERHGEAEVISADNGLRYTPYVLLIETVDLQQVAAAYEKLYPLFQKAYEELGYPNRRFHDRVLALLDHLVATPDVEGPIKVRLNTVNGPIQPPRPWVLYEFEDPDLQALSAGQKLLLRTGPVNERRLKTKLAELRRLLGRADFRR